MSCLGVHFALAEEQAQRLLSASSDEDAKTIVQEEIEDLWDTEWLVEMGKAWDAIHLSLEAGSRLDQAPVLAKCVLGGCQLYHQDDYIISFLTPEETAEVSLAINKLDKEGLRRMYFAIDQSQVEFDLDEDDFETTWVYFEDLKPFFQKAAQARRAVIFTADQ